ncbi:ras-related protein Rab-40B isoform X2 [Felis catus]|uniref:ras-related protein Rab-40B isoform X2 n=1 Tax=Felis catus TaxID=9685 RepID=UPI001D19EB31|nr:ras-related protein Rab-40B isoform X2 [Felis catus]
MGAGAGGGTMSSTLGSPVRAYDFLLKFLLVGDSDVGKGEILASLQDGAAESPYGHPAGIDYKTTTILLDGRRVKLQLWDTSGQGRFCTIFRSYSRGAQGVILVYDIANRWSFDGIDRWIKEIDEDRALTWSPTKPRSQSRELPAGTLTWPTADHAPGVPKILVGNRLHLAFKRQVPTEQAQAYAARLGVTFFEVSPLCNFNITESFTELARTVLLRHGMDRLWRPSKGAPLDMSLYSWSQVLPRSAVQSGRRSSLRPLVSHPNRGSVSAIVSPPGLPTSWTWRERQQGSPVRGH